MRRVRLRPDTYPPFGDGDVYVLGPLPPDFDEQREALLERWENIKPMADGLANEYVGDAMADFIRSLGGDE